ncbi:hypothetical protein ABZ883_08060 [Streptomyces sp. NPDC046977]|uniref:hypothetical protein n=1 Tax=Streptomyces sp. NPDC046977 TaxID=3154703 RepID=UPI0033FA902C
MTASFMLIPGFCFVLLGALALNGRGNAAYAGIPMVAWGWVAMGGGFVLDGGPTLLGFSFGTRATLAGVGLVVIVLGGVLVIWGRSRARRIEQGS